MQLWKNVGQELVKALELTIVGRRLIVSALIDLRMALDLIRRILNR